MTIKVRVGVNEMNITQSDGHEKRSATKKEDENEKEHRCSDHKLKGSEYRIVTAECKICMQKEISSEGCEPDLHERIKGRPLGERRTMNVFFGFESQSLSDRMCGPPAQPYERGV